jgi:L-lactate dehydrogenase complex protein LldG
MADSRARILGRIRSGLEANGELLRRHAAQFPTPHPRGRYLALDDDLENVALFRRELTALFGSVHVTESRDEALAKARSILTDAGAEQVLTWDEAQLPLAGVHAALRQSGLEPLSSGVLAAADRQARLLDLDAVPACLTGADAAVAESGSFALVNGPGRGRLASLLPPLHVALLPAARIVRSLPEAMDLLMSHFGPALFGERSNLVFVTGPSRTADIELSLTLGVHGPREVHVVVFP